MNHKLFFLLLGLLFLGCQDDKLGNEDKSKKQPGWTRESRTNFLPGVIRIKLQSGSSEKVRLSSAAGYSRQPESSKPGSTPPDSTCGMTSASIRMFP